VEDIIDIGITGILLTFISIDSPFCAIAGEYVDK
jgi:hypothetical protein